MWRSESDMYIYEREGGADWVNCVWIIPATGGGDMHSRNASHFIGAFTKYPKGINCIHRMFFAQDGSTEWKH